MAFSSFSIFILTLMPLNLIPHYPSQSLVQQSPHTLPILSTSYDHLSHNPLTTHNKNGIHHSAQTLQWCPPCQ